MHIDKKKLFMNQLGSDSHYSLKKRGRERMDERVRDVELFGG